jgi:hypothetical protein
MIVHAREYEPDLSKETYVRLITPQIKYRARGIKLQRGSRVGMRLSYLHRSILSSQCLTEAFAPRQPSERA